MLQSNSLQNDRSRALDGLIAQDQAEEGGLGELVDLTLAFLRRQYWVIICVAVLGTAASMILLRLTPPTYTGVVKVLLGNPKAQFLQQQSVLAETPVDAALLETQIEIIRSKSIATSVIDQLKLADDPDLTGSGSSLQSIWQRIAQGIWGLSGKTPPARNAEAQDRTTDNTDDLVAAFDDRLSAARIGWSSVLEISYSASDAQRSAQVANAVADAYVRDKLNAKFEANRTATTWLQDRLKELGQQALTAERALDAFKTHNNIVSADGRLMDDQQVEDLNRRLVAARTKTSETLARLNRLQNILASNPADSASIGNLDAAGSDALTNPIINTLRQQYLEFARRETEWSARFGKEHSAAVTLRTRMKGIRTSILDEVRRLSDTAKSDFEMAKQEQQQVENQLELAVSQSRTTTSAGVAMRELETTAKAYRNFYDNFLQRYMGSVQQESFPISDARVISPASPPEKMSKPKSGKILTLGILGGIALGTILGFLRDIMDRVFRTSPQLEAALNVPCLSVVPLLKPSEQNRFLPREVVGKLPSDQRTVSKSAGTYWAATAMPMSGFAESIRSIKLAIDLNPTKNPNKIIGVTSCLPNEGKSTIAASLAQLIGRAGKQVIIVDCDLRNPGLSKNLAPNANAGLIDVISGSRSLEETVWREPKTNLAFLPAGKRGSLCDSSEILSAEQTGKLFEKLRASYDYVIVDLPPLAPMVDARATAPLMDGFILVVEWGRTRTEVVRHVLHSAPNVYDALIGTVLHKTDMREMKRYSSYHSNYNKNHYTRYGQVSAE
jgi:polysaccharide biosynthesis transport protein